MTNFHTFSKMCLLSTIIALSDIALADNSYTKPYTYIFVDAFKEKLSKTSAQQDNIAPINSSSCDCKSITNGSKEINNYYSKSYDQLMQGQFMKNALALLAYKKYKQADDTKKDLYRYIIGIAGYWEVSAANLQGTLIQPTCGENSAVDKWRRGNPTEFNTTNANEIKNFAAITSALGDLYLGIISIKLSKTPFDGSSLSYRWGQIQEAVLEKQVSNNCSADFVNSPINLSGFMNYKGFNLHLLPQFVWINFTTDFLAYKANTPSPSQQMIIEKGKGYLAQYENGINQRTKALMKLAYSRIKTPSMAQKILYNLVKNDTSMHSDDILANLNKNLFHIPRLLEFTQGKNISSSDSNGYLSTNNSETSTANKSVQLAISSNKKVLTYFSDINNSNKDNMINSICKLLTNIKTKEISCSVTQD